MKEQQVIRQAEYPVTDDLRVEIRVIISLPTEATTRTSQVALSWNDIQELRNLTMSERVAELHREGWISEYQDWVSANERARKIRDAMINMLGVKICRDLERMAKDLHK